MSVLKQNGQSGRVDDWTSNPPETNLNIQNTQRAEAKCSCFPTKVRTQQQSTGTRWGRGGAVSKETLQDAAGITGCLEMKSKNRLGKPVG